MLCFFQVIPLYMNYCSDQPFSKQTVTTRLSASDTLIVFLYKETILSAIHSSVPTLVIFLYLSLRHIYFYHGKYIVLMQWYPNFLIPWTTFYAYILFVKAPIIVYSYYLFLFIRRNVASLF